LHSGCPGSSGAHPSRESLVLHEYRVRVHDFGDETDVNAFLSWIARVHAFLRFQTRFIHASSDVDVASSTHRIADGNLRARQRNVELLLSKVLDDYRVS